MTGPITRARLAALTPQEAAALWRVQQDEGSPVEAGLFEEWLAQGDENRLAWAAVENAWHLFDDADDPVFAALRSAALADVGSPPRRRWAAHWQPAAAVAAVAVLVVAAASILFLRSPSGGGEQVATKDATPPAERAYSAPMDRTMNVVLADGTRMRLEPGSEARAQLSPIRRQVVLSRGAAEFTVRHDASRPFTVAARDRSIVDVGTRFKVALAATSMRVALFEGIVRVGDAAGRVTELSPGQQLLVREGRPDMVVPISADRSTPGEMLQFDNVTLAAAIATINRGNTLQLVVTDRKVAGLRISGSFRSDDPARFARTVSELLSLRVVRVSSVEIQLRPRR